MITSPAATGLVDNINVPTVGREVIVTVARLSFSISVYKKSPALKLRLLYSLTVNIASIPCGASFTLNTSMVTGTSGADLTAWSSTATILKASRTPLAFVSGVQ